MKKIIICALFFALLVAPNLAQPTEATGPYNPYLCTRLPVNLQVGSRDGYSQHVSSLQRYLYEAGFLRVNPTGYFGYMTRAAVVNFQRAYAIYPNGIANAQTRAKIQELTCNVVVQPPLGKAINLQLKNPSSVYGPNSNVSFTWNASYKTQYPFGAYLLGQNGIDVVSKYLGVQSSGESYLTLPANIPSGTYTLFVVDEVTDRGSPIKSNIIPIQVNGGIVNPGPTFIKILSPNGSPNRDDVYQGGQQVALNLQMPSDKAYYVAYYLVPQSGTPVRNTNGTAYDSTMGGYSLGGFQYNYAVSNPSLYITLPSDIYTGKYKVKVVMREVSINVGVNANPIVGSDESDYALMLYTHYQDGAPSSTPLTIVSPNGGETIRAGGTFRLKVTSPSDKIYSYSYYLTPQPGTPVKNAPGTYYDPVSGGYSIGGYVPTYATGGIDNTVAMPIDIPAGTYKLRVYLRNKNETSGSPTAATAISYDDSNNGFTVTDQNGQTGTPILRITSPNSTGVVWNSGESRTISWTSANLDPNTRLLISLRSSTGDLCVVGAATAGSGSFTFTPRVGDRCGNSYSYTTLQRGYYLAHITTEIQTMIYPSTAPVDISDEYFELKEGSSTTLVTPTISSFGTDYTYAGYNPTITIWGTGFNSSSKVIVAENYTVTPQYISPDGTSLSFKLPSQLVSQAGLYRVVVANYSQYGDNRLSNSLYFRVWGFLNY